MLVREINKKALGSLGIARGTEEKLDRVSQRTDQLTSCNTTVSIPTQELP
jgi:hypothetical protein